MAVTLRFLSIVGVRYEKDACSNPDTILTPNQELPKPLRNTSKGSTDFYPFGIRHSGMQIN